MKHEIAVSIPSQNPENIHIKYYRHTVIVLNREEMYFTLISFILHHKGEVGSISRQVCGRTAADCTADRRVGIEIVSGQKPKHTGTQAILYLKFGRCLVYLNLQNLL